MGNIDFTDRAPVFCDSCGGSATRYGSTEDVGVVPVVVAELEFRDIQRQVFCRDVVESAQDAALEQRPEAVDGLGVNHATDILAGRVPHRFVFETALGQANIQAAFVRGDQINLLGYRLTYEGFGGALVNTGERAGNQRALAGDGADYRELVGNARAFQLFVGVPVLVLSADVGFIDFHDAHEFAKLRVNQGGADTVRHVERGLIRAEAHHALDFERRHAFLTGQHHVDDFEPLAEADIGILKWRADRDGETVAGTRAPAALPVERPGFQLGQLFIVAPGAAHAFRPTPSREISLAGFVRGEKRIELADRHLLGELLGHRSYPRV